MQTQGGHAYGGSATTKWREATEKRDVPTAPGAETQTKRWANEPCIPRRGFPVKSANGLKARERAGYSGWVKKRLLAGWKAVIWGAQLQADKFPKRQRTYPLSVTQPVSCGMQSIHLPLSSRPYKMEALTPGTGCVAQRHANRGRGRAAPAAALPPGCNATWGDGRSGARSSPQPASVRESRRRPEPSPPPPGSGVRAGASRQAARTNFD